MFWQIQQRAVLLAWAAGLGCAAALLPIAATGQTVAEIESRAAAARSGLSPGLAIIDPSGAALGSVRSVDQQVAVLDTGHGSLSVPLSAFTYVDGHWASLLSAGQLATVSTAAVSEEEASALTSAAQ